MTIVITSPNIYPGVRAYLGAAQSLANNAAPLIAFTAVVFDPWQMWTDPAGNPSKLYCNVPGYYVCSAKIAYQSNATGIRFTSILRNGTNAIASGTVVANTGAETDQLLTGIYTLNVGDYVQLSVFQNSGGALNALGSASGGDTWLSLYRLP